MEDLAQDIKTPSSRNLVMQSQNSDALVNTKYLFKEGLALANQLDHQRSSRGNLIYQMSEDSEDCTAIQPNAALKIPLSSTTTYVQTDSDQSWTQVWLQRGLIKLKQQNFEGAVDNFNRVLQRETQSIEAFNGLSVAQYYLAQYQDAAASLRQAIEIRPTQPTLFCNLGAVFYRSQDFIGAVAAFQKAARLDPRDILAYYGMGLSLIHQQDYPRAIAAFQRAIALNDQHAKSYYGLGYVHFQMGDLPAAIAAIGKAKQRNPEYAKRYETFLKHCLEQDGKA
jgi:tetratricopeptide (TPR) repeat protein